MRKITAAAALIGLASIVSGAWITSVKVSLQPGQLEPSAMAHRAIAIAATAVVCAAFLAGSRSHSQRIAAGSSLVFLIAGAAIGWNYPLAPGAAVWHAAFAHLFTAAIVIALVLSSESWRRPAKPVDAGSFAALRPTAIVTPFAVLGQIVMGALYRHQVTGIMPHMLGAMVVALLTLVVSAIVLQNFSGSKELKPAAVLLITAVLLQICLGIAVFLLLLLNASSSTAFLWVATAHVTTGTLVLAASIFMAMQARRCLAHTVTR
jgi:heme A synthase